MEQSGLALLAVPAVCLLVAALSYGSQALFTWSKDEQTHLTDQQWWIFNALVLCLWICYARAINVDAGEVPEDWTTEHTSESPDGTLGRQRYCRKCDALKPPRAHHCKVCGRCIPKMDHHCPWTGNCVSHKTFPHFMRFLFYAVVSMIYLERFLYDRCAAIWGKRHSRYDLGPSATHMSILFVLLVTNSLTLFLVGIIFFRTFYSLSCNVTTIESWEIERHEQLLKRARVLGGYLDGPDGIKVRITKQEFPFDIGIFRNIAAGMGTNNFLAWLWPLARTPRTDGTSFETNGFEDPGTSWPPPDPDRMPRLQRNTESAEAFTVSHNGLNGQDEVEAFKRRQQADFDRRAVQNGHVLRRKSFHERFAPETYEPLDDNEAGTDSGEEGWQDSGGNRLKDYGVDEDVEFYDEDEIPLAELLRRRKEKRSA